MPPARLASAARGHQPRTPRALKWMHVDLWLSRFERTERDPAPVGRKLPLVRCKVSWNGRKRFGSLVANGEHPELALTSLLHVINIEEKMAVPGPVFGSF